MAPPTLKSATIAAEFNVWSTYDQKQKCRTVQELSIGSSFVKIDATFRKTRLYETLPWRRRVDADQLFRNSRAINGANDAIYFRLPFWDASSSDILTFPEPLRRPLLLGNAVRTLSINLSTDVLPER